MKHLNTWIILVGAVGAFFSGFFFWMAYSSHQDAERLRRQGRYTYVEVLGKHTSSPGDGSSTSHYVDVKPLDAPGETRRITCSVAGGT